MGWFVYCEFCGQFDEYFLTCKCYDKLPSDAIIKGSVILSIKCIGSTTYGHMLLTNGKEIFTKATNNVIRQIPANQYIQEIS